MVPVTPEDFAALLTPEGRALLDSLHDYDPAQELAVATRLRREHPAALVSAALGQARLRQRASVKFGAEDAFRMYFTPGGGEMATRASVASYRGRAARGPRRTQRRGPVLRHRRGRPGPGPPGHPGAGGGPRPADGRRRPGQCRSAGARGPDRGQGGGRDHRRHHGYDAVFIDPARRGGRGRIFDPESYSPPLSWAVAAARSAPYAAIKIAPGIPHEAVPAEAEAEWISDQGDVKEAVLWFGTEPGSVRATLLPGPRALRTADPLPDPEAGPVGRYLYEPDGAVIRAHLVAEVAEQLGGRLIDPTIAYITADELRATPYATAYEITDVLPFGLKKLKALLRERGVGVLTVKKRGSAIEPEELRKKVKPQGPHSATVILTRVDGAPSMLIGAPVERR